MIHLLNIGANKESSDGAGGPDLTRGETFNWAYPIGHAENLAGARPYWTPTDMRQAFDAEYPKDDTHTGRGLSLWPTTTSRLPTSVPAAMSCARRTVR